MNAGSGLQAELAAIRAQLEELRQIVVEGNAQPNDLVGPDYIARRTGLKPRTIIEGKAGTKSIPRVYLGRSVRFARRDADKFVSDRINEAHQKSSPQRSIRLLVSERRRKVS